MQNDELFFHSEIRNPQLKYPTAGIRLAAGFWLLASG
jgi:hypothetical protein